MDLLDMTRLTWVEIDLDKLAYNMQTIKELVDDDLLVTAVVKGNGYGHGSIQSAKVFLENGADRLAVATLSEAIELRKAGIEDSDILILGHTPPYQFSSVIHWNITQTIYSIEAGKLLSEEATKMGKTVKIHIKIDTGMGRLGFLINDKAIKDIVKISKYPNLHVEGIYTHFSTADTGDKTYTKKQYEKFIDILKKLEEKGINIPIRHVANSGSIIDLAEYNLDMVRGGIVLYGLYPSEEVHKEKLLLKPAMTLKTKVCHIKKVPIGTSISYYRDFITLRESKIATLPIGYADGISRQFAEEGEVLIKGSRAPIIGKICMDQTMIDVSDISDIMLGEEVVFFGDEEKGHPSINEIASKLGTINYEVLCMIGRRVPRVYIKNGRTIDSVDYLLRK